jgi:carboxymethylenebutenolidase
VLVPILGALMAAAPGGSTLPPGGDQAKAALETTPRHGEYVDVAYPGGPAIRSFVVYPERKDKAPVVIVLHEIFGLSDWIRAVADRLAADGFIAVAPDLISGLGPGGGGTASVKSVDDVRELVRGLADDEADARIDAVRAFALKLPAATDMSATLGFCWGGTRSFAYAVREPRLDAAVVFYGSSPETARLRKLKVPVLGLYGGDDARVNVGIDPAAVEIEKRGRSYEHEIYDGAGHGFLRDQAGREGANLRATEEAWPRVVAFLRKHLE